jgi:hypothetical protein
MMWTLTLYHVVHSKDCKDGIQSTRGGLGFKRMKWLEHQLLIGVNS